MNMSDLEDYSHHLNDKITSLKHLLELSVDAKTGDMIGKIAQDVDTIAGLLDEFDKLVAKENVQLTRLKEMEMFFQNELKDGRHLQDNIPEHMPRKKALGVSEPPPCQKGPVEQQPAKQENIKKPTKRPIKEMEVITMPEYDAIPAYMKGRITYGQLNASVQVINTAVTGKYKILRQPAKNLNNHERQLQQRFKEEETKDTKGNFFVVEKDLCEFGQMKMDKRFQGMMSMLRHCQRLREVRGQGLTRYMLL